MNRIIITGRLTREPEIRYTQTQKAVANYSLAVNRPYKRDGEPDADFFDITAFDKAAEFVGKYFHKGMLVAVSGSIRFDQYTTRNGEQRTKTVLYSDHQEFCESKSNAPAPAGQAFTPPPANFANLPPMTQGVQQNLNDVFVPVDPAEGDKDLPF